MLIIDRKSIMLIHRPQTPQPGFGSITLLQNSPPISKSWIRVWFIIRVDFKQQSTIWDAL